MITIVITSFKEPDTIGKAIESFIKQDLKEDYELIVSAPDRATQDVAMLYARVNKRIKVFPDAGKGKTHALNDVLPMALGDIIILSDGDVFVSKDSIKELLKEFEDKKVGCVGGRPLPIEDKSTKWGFFANFLFDSAHELRQKRRENGEFVEVSGYLWAFRNGVIEKIPLRTAEDSIVPLMFYYNGWKIGYAPNAKVYIKNVDNWKDWFNQKIRTSKAHETLGRYFPDRPVMKGFSQEAKGAIKLFSYPANLKEFFWLTQLIFMRGYMWYKVKKGKEFKGNWKAIPSTKSPHRPNSQSQ